MDGSSNFTEREGDGIESRLPFKIFSTLRVTPSAPPYLVLSELKKEKYYRNPRLLLRDICKWRQKTTTVSKQTGFFFVSVAVAAYNTNQTRHKTSKNSDSTSRSGGLITKLFGPKN